ncbi:MAG: APC family permease [Anaerolineaceae bacterium]
MSGEQDGTEAGAPTLRRTLGFWQLTAGGVGIIIGAGIYVLLGAATAKAGPPVWAAFLLAAVLCALTALSYAELASMFPSAAAEYEFTRHAFPEWLAFLVGWVMIAGLVVAAAAVSLGFARYLGQFVDLGQRGPALGLIVVVSLIAVIGIKQSSWVILALSTIQVGGLLAIIAIGAGHLGEHQLTAGVSSGGVLGAAALVFFAFIGFDEVITLSEETRNPTKTVPKALLAALAISTALYVLVAIAAVSVLGAQALSESERPLADVMAEVAGGGAGNVVAVIALISTTNTTLLALTAASRLVYGMASSSALPFVLAAVNRRTGTPIRAILVATMVSAGFVFVGKLTLVASITDFAVYLVFLAVNGTVIVLRWREPERARPFRVPGPAKRVPLLAILGIASVALMITRLELDAILLGLVMCALGLGAGWFETKRRRQSGGRAGV